MLGASSGKWARQVVSAIEQSLRQTLHALYSDHHGWLQGWLRKRLGCTQNAQDLAHDTFVRLITAPDAARRVADIRAPRDYLTTIARRVMIDHFRRRTLERAYLHRQEARERGLRGAATQARRTWATTAAGMKDIILSL